MLEAPTYTAGEKVDVFYRMGQDPGGYFPVGTASAGSVRPRFGRTDGWIPAEVAEDWPMEPKTAKERNHRVRIRHTHLHWSNRRGERLDTEDDTDMIISMPPEDVRKRGQGHDASYRTGVDVSLSLLVVRWGGAQTTFNVEQWGAASSSVSDQYIETVLDETLYRAVGPDYEVLTVFVEGEKDLLAMQPAAITAMMAGRHRYADIAPVHASHASPHEVKMRPVTLSISCPLLPALIHGSGALYFLWPTAFDETENDQSGMVNHVSYFQVVSAVEAAGVPTRFPHPSALYQSLLNKDWQPTLCLVPRFHIPPTTTVNRAHVECNPAKAAKVLPQCWT